MSSIKTASVLAFEKKLCNSDGLMYAGLWENRNDTSAWNPIKLQHKDVKGTISNRLNNPKSKDKKSEDQKNDDRMKLDASIQNANLQSVDSASLPFDCDTLKVVFTLRVLKDLSLPVTCNNQDYQRELTKKIGDYLEKQKCTELSFRYAQSLATGRFLWRNRVGAEEIEIKVSLVEGGEVKDTWKFNGFQYSLRNFSVDKDPQLTKMAEAIRMGLMGESYVFFQVEAFARIGAGQEVFPSQELVRAADNEKYPKRKVLYAVNEIGAMHSQKIGNAIRTIDTWYPDADDFGPIAIEPYGSVTSRGVAYRKPNEKMDFYSLLDGWILKNIIPALEQQHYVVACLIRGGVFGEKEKE